MDDSKKVVTVTRLSDNEKLQVRIDEVCAWGSRGKRGQQIHNIIVFSKEIEIVENWEDVKRASEAK